MLYKRLEELDGMDVCPIEASEEILALLIAECDRRGAITNVMENQLGRRVLSVYDKEYGGPMYVRYNGELSGQSFVIRKC
jgi:hypothetical protein